MDKKVDSQLDFNFPSSDLLEFPRDLGEEGWFQFYAKKGDALNRLESKFNIPLNKKVKVNLHGEDASVEGLLTLNRLKMPSADAEEIELRIGRRVFLSSSIESIELVKTK